MLDRGRARRWIGALAGTSALIVVLAACGGSSSPGGGSGSSGGSAASSASSSQVPVTVPLAAPLAVIDPTVDTAAGNAVYQTVFQTLVFYSDPSGTPIPSLAKSWTTSPDGLTWTFNLNPSAKFSDGTAVTSADVVFTIQKEMVAGNPHAGTLTNLASVDASDPETVNFHLKSANAAFLAIISAKYIVPAAYYQQVGADGFSKAPIGSGPFKIDSEAGGGAVVVLNPTYTAIKQQYSKITFTPVPSAQSQVAGLQSGTLDIVPNIASSQVDQLKSDANIEIKETDSSGGVSFIAFDTTTAPGNNLDFRKAVDEAIDRNAMVKTIMNGHAQVATGLFTPSVVDYDKSRKAPTFDLTQAKKDLAASGYSGQAIDMTYPTSVLVNADLVAQSVQSFLGDLGVKVNLIPLDYTTFLQKWAAHQITGMYIMQYQNGIDPDTIISSLYAGGSRVMFTDQQVTDEVNQTRTTTGDARFKALQTLENTVINTDYYYAPLMVPHAIYGVKKGIPFTANPITAIYINYK
jgi:peptide/nickel transport system substrate-binding protein